MEIADYELNIDVLTKYENGVKIMKGSFPMNVEVLRHRDCREVFGGAT